MLKKCGLVTVVEDDITEQMQHKRLLSISEQLLIHKTVIIFAREEIPGYCRTEARSVARRHQNKCRSIAKKQH